jgi:hypothetical protein
MAEMPAGSVKTKTRWPRGVSFGAPTDTGTSCWSGWGRRFHSDDATVLGTFISGELGWVPQEYVGAVAAGIRARAH